MEDGMHRTAAQRGFPVGRALATALVAAAALTAFASIARADDDADPQSPPPAVTRAVPPQNSSPDFLFGAPRGWIGVRGGQLFPRAGGDLFSFFTDQLTLDKSDFHSGAFTTEVGVVLGPRVYLVGAFDVTKHGASSEYRHFVASNAQPITQETHLDQMDVSAGVRLTPFGKGRSISRYAFIPRRVTPYVGAGATALFYDLSQSGQFVDFVDRSIFFDRFASQGWAFGPYASVGADVQLWKRLYATFDGRYLWLHADLEPDFSGFGGIDLAGFKASSGISIGF
jgi:hypothetical protein